MCISKEQFRELLTSHEDIPTCEITCPKCAGKSHIIDWRPGHCPHCQADLREYIGPDLQAVPREPIRVSVNQLTGEPVVLGESA